jgi:hypothetical protein
LGKSEGEVHVDSQSPRSTTPTRLGLHYFPDTQHYRELDLQTWLPELRALGVGWLTLLASAERAIPEPFVGGLLAAGIEPLVHFPLTLLVEPPAEERATLRLLFGQLARQGAHYVTLFDRPNLRSAWPTAAWAQADLVERFLDRFIPLAEEAVDAGLIPLFPPLEPGGDYWDLAFWRSALRGLGRRKRVELLTRLEFAGYAWAGSRPLNWGIGGPERWPGARPYFTPAGVEDQRGLRSFDWQQAVITAEVGAPRPIFLLRAGVLPDAGSGHAQASRTLALVEALETGRGVAVETGEIVAPIPAEVRACCLWLLGAGRGSAAARQGWYSEGGNPQLEVVTALKRWQARRGALGLAAGMFAPAEAPAPVSVLPDAAAPEAGVTPPFVAVPEAAPTESTGLRRRIRHYLLLPLYAWGVADWDLDQALPIIQSCHPTVGFSLEEACSAERVSLLGTVTTYPAHYLTRLEAAGCQIEVLSAAGTNLAS